MFVVLECDNRPFRLDVWVCSSLIVLDDHVFAKGHNVSQVGDFPLNSHVFKVVEFSNEPFGSLLGHSLQYGLDDPVCRATKVDMEISVV